MIQILALIFLFFVCGCSSVMTNVVRNDIPDRLRPSNERTWSPEFTRLPEIELVGNQAIVRNVRNNSYISEKDFVLNFEERRYDLDKIKRVDFLVCPFQNAQFLAHTMLSFEFEGDQFLAVSAEIRTEKGEAYSPFLGITNQFEITYVVADEKDLVRLRTRHRNAEVYVYPTIATPDKARQLFIDVMQRVNQLAAKPEFYHTILNNCTTSIVEHVNAISPNRVPYNYSVLLPGLSARYAYDLGLLDQSVPFAQLKATVQCYGIVGKIL